MPVLHSLSVKDCFLLKDVTLPLHEGITFIGGRNLDRSSDSGNAVGKSMLWSLLGGIVFQEQLWATKGVRNTNKTIAGEVAVSVGVGKDEYVITQTNKGMKAQYGIEKNGEAVSIRTVKDTVSEIAGILPLNREHYISTVYIGGESTPILRGSSAERLSFFSGLWDFSSYEEKLTKLKKMRSELKATVARKEVYSEESAGLDYVDMGPLEDTLNKIKGKRSKLSTSLSDVRGELNTHQRYLEAEENKPDVDPDECRETLADLTEAQREYDQYEDRLDRWESYERRKQSLEGKLTNADNPSPQTLEDARGEAMWAEQVIDFWEKYRATYDKLQPLWNKDSSVPDKQERKKAKRAITILESELDKIEGLEDTGTCPTCFSELTPEHKEEMLGDVKARLTEAMELSNQLEANAFYHAFKGMFGTSEQEAIDSFHETETTIKEQEALTKAWDKDQEILRRLSDLTPCEKPEGNPQDHQPEIKKLNRALAGYEQYEKQRHPDHSVTLADLQADKKDMEEEIASLEERVQALIEKEKDATVAFSEAENANAQLERMEKKSAGLEDDKKRLDVVAWLCNQFSPKGIQQAYMQTVVGAYIDNLNRYYSTILPEPPLFSFFMDGSTFDIMAKRNGANIDIRSFSKSEGKQFCAVSALALRDILPSRCLLDTIILDEIEEGMSSYEREHYLTNFLPYVATIVPKVVVVTPRMDVKDVVAGRAFMLVRENNRTDIVES